MAQPKPIILHFVVEVPLRTSPHTQTTTVRAVIYNRKISTTICRVIARTLSIRAILATLFRDLQCSRTSKEKWQIRDGCLSCNPNRLRLTSENTSTAIRTHNRSDQTHLLPSEEITRPKSKISSELTAGLRVLPHLFISRAKTNRPTCSSRRFRCWIADLTKLMTSVVILAAWLKKNDNLKKTCATFPTCRLTIGSSFNNKNKKSLPSEKSLPPIRVPTKTVKSMCRPNQRVTSRDKAPTRSRLLLRSTLSAWLRFRGTTSVKGNASRITYATIRRPKWQRRIYPILPQIKRSLQMKMKSSDAWRNNRISLETAKAQNSSLISTHWIRRRNLTSSFPTILMIYNSRLTTLTSKNT